MKFLTCLNCFESARKRICTNPDHIKYKRQVTPRICLRCKTTEREEKLPRQEGKFQPKIERSGRPSEKPQEAHTEPPEITPLGTLIYARTGWEPPPCPPGYVRRSSDLESDDAYILDPIQTLCKHLSLLVAEKGSCGYHRIKRRCCLIKSYVGPTTCGDCTYREVPDGAGETK